MGRVEKGGREFGGCMCAGEEGHWRAGPGEWEEEEQDGWQMMKRGTCLVMWWFAVQKAWHVALCVAQGAMHTHNKALRLCCGVRSCAVHCAVLCCAAQACLGTTTRN